LSSSINNSSGVITGVTSGGTTPYSYTFSGPTGLILSVSNNNGTPVSINVLSSGNYSLVVTDFNGCTDSVGIFISNNDFSPSFDVLLSNNLCDSMTDLTIIVSQDSGEVDMSTGLITSNAGYFDIAAYNIGDTIGTATLMAAGGSINLNTMIMISNIISANSAVVVACDSVQGCIGGFTINNTVGGGINILTNTVPDGNNYTSGNMSSITFESIFVNPCIPLTFYYTINSELGDVFTDSITFTITSTQNYSIEEDVLIYPNPNDGRFIIQANKEYKEIRVLVTDILGKNIYFDNFYSNLRTQEINLDVDNGLYLISLQNGNRVIYSRNIVIYR